MQTGLFIGATYVPVWCFVGPTRGRKLSRILDLVLDYFGVSYLGCYAVVITFNFSKGRNRDFAEK